MTIHMALHLRDDINTLYVLRIEGGRGLARIEDSMDASIRRFKDYIKGTKKDQLKRPETTQTQ